MNQETKYLIEDLFFELTDTGVKLSINSKNKRDDFIVTLLTGKKFYNESQWKQFVTKVYSISNRFCKFDKTYKVLNVDDYERNQFMDVTFLKQKVELIRCKGITAKGIRCSRMSKDEFCNQHKKKGL